MKIARRKFFGLGSAMVGLFGFGASQGSEPQEQEEDVATDDELEKAWERIQAKPMSVERALHDVYFEICDQRVDVEELVKEICMHVTGSTIETKIPIKGEKETSLYIWKFIFESIAKFSWDNFTMLAGYNWGEEQSSQEQEARYEALREGLKKASREYWKAWEEEIEAEARIAQNHAGEEIFNSFNKIIKEKCKDFDKLLATKKTS